MSERRLSTSLNRRLSRAKESFLQSIGKTGKTQDEEFEACFKNFTDHQNSVVKYQREAKDYYEALKRYKISNKLLMRAIWDLYDPSWVESNQLQVKSDTLSSMFEVYVNSFKKAVLDPIEGYISRINGINEKIMKRDKRRLDYDAGKHKLEKRESAKVRKPERIEKATKDLEELRNAYELVNADLIEDLYKFYDARVCFIGHNLLSFFGTESKFHSDCSVMFTQLADGMQTLNEHGGGNSFRKSCSSKSGTSSESSSRPSSPELAGLPDAPPAAYRKGPRPSDAFDKVEGLEELRAKNVPEAISEEDNEQAPAQSSELDIQNGGGKDTMEADEKQDVQKAEEKQHVQKPEEKQDVQEAEENQDVQKPEEKQDVQKPEEKQDVQKADEKQDVQKADEEQDVQKAGEKQDVQKEDEKENVEKEPVSEKKDDGQGTNPVDEAATSSESSN